MIQDIAPHRLDNAYRPDAMPQAQNPVICVDGQNVLCHLGGGTFGSRSLAFPRVSDLPTGRDLSYLFSIDATAYWLCDRGAASGQPNGFAFVSSRRLREERHCPNELMLAVYTAIHLAGWYRANRFCGACASPMARDASLRALRCPRCGNVVFPRLNPAVIVCVCDPSRNRIVLTRYAHGRYAQIDALVAGFVEIGETLEQCVRREVREELGISVTNIRYYKSQPWGVAADILAGFWADVEGDPTLRRDERELGRAVWASPEEVTGQPDSLSLTNEMMCVWRDEHLQAGTAASPLAPWSDDAGAVAHT